MGWFANRRRKRLQKTVREVSGTTDESAVRLSVLDDEHLAALATVAARAKSANRAWAFRVILPDLIGQARDAQTVAEAPDELFTRELDGRVGVRAKRALGAAAAEVAAALPAGAELDQRAALRTAIDLLRYGVKDEEFATSLADTIRKQPGSYVKKAEEPQEGAAEA